MIFPLATTNELQINGDFHVFTDAVEHLCDKHKDKPGIHRPAEEVMREWYAQTLVEAVLGSKALAGTRAWSGDSAKILLSEESLTSAVLGGRYVHLKRLANILSNKIGRGHAQKLDEDVSPVEAPKSPAVK